MSPASPVAPAAGQPAAGQAAPPPLAVRVIPCLDVKAGRVVKGVRFAELRDLGDPAELAARYAREGADEVCFLDIAASPEGRGTLAEVLARVAEACFVPLTAGGGVRSADDMRRLLLAGADKVTVNSAAVADPGLVGDCASRFGAQCVVLAIDAKRRKDGTGWEVLTHGGRRESGREAVAWARAGAAAGAGEILLTSFDQDGTGAGFDVELLAAVAEAVPLPVIASGGAGSLHDLAEAVRLGQASAVLAASIFHDRLHTPAEARQALLDAGLPARPLA